jgi:Delta7-sterol 5-desaturase
MSPFLESFGQQYGPFLAWLLASFGIFLRYAIPASLVFIFVYKMKRSDWFFWKIQQKFPKNKQIQTEIINSFITSLIFGGMVIGVYVLRKMGYGAMYFDISERGWGYYFFSIAFMIFAHDAYFYWTHRLMHHPKLFKLFHLVHHQSVNTTPYTSFSFHPLESVVEFGIIPIIAVFMPIHLSALIVFTVFSIVFNVFGHTGYEIAPSGFTRHWLFKWLNTPTHHNMHHEKSRFNYSLYFNIWDRLMNTNHPEYDHTFEQIKSRTQSQLDAAKNIAKAGTASLFLLISLPTFSQVSVEGLKKGEYSTPEVRAAQADDMMIKGLALRTDQVDKVKDINRRYAVRAEQEVVQQNMNNWSKYRKIMAIQEEKDVELKNVLNVEQYKKYEAKRDAMFWDAVKAFFL